MAASPTSDALRVRVHAETLAALTDWQARALRRRGIRPSYGDLVDAMACLVEANDLDLVDALETRGRRRGAG